ncbi:TIGR03620 family F420-dependent LLM class oxidoreductase [Saccharopolyspora karakumensis]|uniref:TIGR03620 family F420-dependent LLM class oxidoreductase n=1 Tax=Saccharopolyspora karakumensis TaxID=2530386 RepID=A0A4R5B435_9PSEU|nr:TIGR03620 family F420-dependent LLM class oxidoreductase [Saccharopolyspora karakumensis]TDD79985.1 TIGR03620 family F420-dependent LLM class oxidoreductase [Saccharopolyspora karakumensis]
MSGTWGLGRVGLALDVDGGDEYLRQAVEAEELGYGALWVLGGQLSTLDPLAGLVRATREVAVAPGIIPLDRFGADEVVELFGRVEAEAPGRLFAGFGGLQARPVSATREVLDGLDGRIPASRRLLAALGPRKLDLARDSAAGAITMLVTSEYTAQARARLGPEAVLVVCQLVALDEDRSRAREVLRGPLGFLVGSEVTGYAANMRRMGFGEADLAVLGDRLVDAVAGAGGAGVISAGVRAHLEAGADHVVLCAQSGDGLPGPIELGRALAGELL